MTVMAGLKEVVERKGVFCALYSDRGSHFWLTPKLGAKVDYHRRTQVGRALHELGVQMIPAYSPEARGRSERNFGTWQGRLPQELRLRQIRTREGQTSFCEGTWLSSIAVFRSRRHSGERGNLGEPFYFLGAFRSLRSFAFSCRDVSPLRLTLTNCFLAGVFCITMSYEF